MSERLNRGKVGKWITRETSHEWVDDFCSLCGYKTDAFSKLKECPQCGAEMQTVWEAAKQEPAASESERLVKVVRCKECKWFVKIKGICKLFSNNYEPPVYMDDDDFCSRGERREDA